MLITKVKFIKDRLCLLQCEVHLTDKGATGGIFRKSSQK